jgi:hypothetical protein
MTRVILLLVLLASCHRKAAPEATPLVGPERAIEIAYVTARRREPVSESDYVTSTELLNRSWIVKLTPKRHGKGGSIWIYVDGKSGAVTQTKFWQ